MLPTMLKAPCFFLSLYAFFEVAVYSASSPGNTKRQSPPTLFEQAPLAPNSAGERDDDARGATSATKAVQREGSSCNDSSSSKPPRPGTPKPQPSPIRAPLPQLGFQLASQQEEEPTSRSSGMLGSLLRRGIVPSASASSLTGLNAEHEAAGLGTSSACLMEQGRTATDDRSAPEPSSRVLFGGIFQGQHVVDAQFTTMRSRLLKKFCLAATGIAAASSACAGMYMYGPQAGSMAAQAGGFGGSSSSSSPSRSRSAYDIVAPAASSTFHPRASTSSTSFSPSTLGHDFAEDADAPKGLLSDLEGRGGYLPNSGDYFEDEYLPTLPDREQFEKGPEVSVGKEDDESHHSSSKGEELHDQGAVFAASKNKLQEKPCKTKNLLAQGSSSAKDGPSDDYVKVDSRTSFIDPVTGKTEQQVVENAIPSGVESKYTSILVGERPENSDSEDQEKRASLDTEEATFDVSGEVLASTEEGPSAALQRTIALSTEKAIDFAALQKLWAMPAAIYNLDDDTPTMKHLVNLRANSRLLMRVVHAGDRSNFEHAREGFTVARRRMTPTTMLGEKMDNLDLLENKDEIDTVANTKKMALKSSKDKEDDLDMEKSNPRREHLTYLSGRWNDMAVVLLPPVGNESPIFFPHQREVCSASRGVSRFMSGESKRSQAKKSQEQLDADFDDVFQGEFYLQYFDADKCDVLVTSTGDLGHSLFEHSLAERFSEDPAVRAAWLAEYLDRHVPSDVTVSLTQEGKEFLEENLKNYAKGGDGAGALLSAVENIGASKSADELVDAVAERAQKELEKSPSRNIVDKYPQMLVSCDREDALVGMSDPSKALLEDSTRAVPTARLMTHLMQSMGPNIGDFFNIPAPCGPPLTRGNVLKTSTRVDF
ncbi:unnamed protein product [Amoebophrya sp. A25]|nr:unnamed protein product [Amoebophrya sp. A25]|eukprot:GSA25T00024503001.1